MSVHKTNTTLILALDDICVTHTGMLFTHVLMLINRRKVIIHARDYVTMRDRHFYSIEVFSIYLKPVRRFDSLEIKLTLDQIY
jgi:hypothetical protein